MGAWGPGAFQNDQALDWLGEVESEDDSTLVDDALGTVVGAADGDYLDADDCSVAIAAAELVAAMGGQPSPRLPDGIKDWCDEQEEPDPEMVSDALAALTRIREASELVELWTEGGELNQRWVSGLEDLARRLGAANTAEG
jgi:hypothetical protein